MNNNSPPGRRALLLLAGALALAGVIVLILAFLPKSTVVEITVRAEQVSFILPGPRPPDTAILLFDPGVRAASLQWKGADEVIAVTGPAAAQLDTMPLPRDGAVNVSSEEPFHPALRLRRDMHLSLRPYRQEKIVLTLAPLAETPHAWQSSVASMRGLRLRRENSAASNFLTQADAGELEVPPAAPPVFFNGGKGPAELGLRLPATASRPMTVMQIVEVESGEVSEPRRVAVDLPEPKTALAAGNRIIVFEKEKEPAGQLLCANLAVRAPEFYRLSGFQEESFLLGGRVRFPAKEKETVELERDAFLRIEGAHPLRLKTLHVKNGALELVLWGKPASIELGPTLGLSNQLLPSYLLWFYTHRLGTLIFSVLTAVTTISLSVLKLLGMLKT